MPIGYLCPYEKKGHARLGVRSAQLLRSLVRGHCSHKDSSSAKGDHPEKYMSGEDMPGSLHCQTGHHARPEQRQLLRNRLLSSKKLKYREARPLCLPLVASGRQRSRVVAMHRVIARYRPGSLCTAFSSLPLQTTLQENDNQQKDAADHILPEGIEIESSTVIDRKIILKLENLHNHSQQ